MAQRNDRFTIIIEKGKKRFAASAPLSGIHRLVFVINHQFTNAPNTTQIASGSGRSSAAGSNAAIKSPNTRQQQSVGAGGSARNKGGGGQPPGRSGNVRVLRRIGKEVVVVINDQIVKLSRRLSDSSATQIASGSGIYSTGGTNSAISSPGTRQQHAVGGGGTASNQWGKGRKKRKQR